MKPAGSFDALLAVLGPTPDQAAAVYRQLHARLTRLFTLNNAADPGELADETMDRLARSVQTRPIASPVAFALGIARLLLKEEARERAKAAEVARGWTESVSLPTESADKEILLARLDRCLERMSAERRELLRAYYAWADAAKIEHHRMLAGQMRVSVHALRNRVMRARVDLAACMKRSQRDVSGISGTLMRGRQRSLEEKR